MCRWNYLRYVALLLFTPLFLLLPNAVKAADQYCAQRVLVEPSTQCFNALQEAEAFIRVEPSPADGSKYLEVSKVNQISLGYFSTYYAVKARTYEKYAGDWYDGATIGGWGSREFNCSPNKIPFLSAANSYKCSDESEVAAEAAAYFGANWSISFGGQYISLPPLSWNSIDKQDSTERAYVSVVMNRYAESGRQMFASYDGHVYPHVVNRVDYFECPKLYNGTSHYEGYPLADPWPLICGSQAYEYISKQKSLQYNSCDTKDGNPCVAATGNKEYRETDFSWEGQPFSRASDLPPINVAIQK